MMTIELIKIGGMLITFLVVAIGIPRVVRDKPGFESICVGIAGAIAYYIAMTFLTTGGK
jgi:hypothetical protein